MIDALLRFPVLVNPNNRQDGWTDVTTGTVGNMAAISLDAEMVLRSARLLMEWELNVGAGDSWQLFVNGAGTNLKGMEAFWSAGGATPASNARALAVLANTAAEATTNKVRIWGEMTLQTGQYRFYKTEFVSYATVSDRPEAHGICHGSYKDTATAISSIQLCAVGVGSNILTGSKARIRYSD